jgi:hypothetical protein
MFTVLPNAEERETYHADKQSEESKSKSKGNILNYVDEFKPFRNCSKQKSKQAKATSQINEQAKLCSSAENRFKCFHEKLLSINSMVCDSQEPATGKQKKLPSRSWTAYV